VQVIRVKSKSRCRLEVKGQGNRENLDS